MKTWTDPTTGFKLQIVKHARMGHYCGYIFLPPGHPMHGKSDIDWDVHGGVTWTSLEKDGTWKVGFDCAHLGDLVPSMGPSAWEPEATFKDAAFAERECAKMAAQAVVNLEKPT